MIGIHDNADAKGGRGGGGRGGGGRSRSGGRYRGSSNTGRNNIRRSPSSWRGSKYTSLKIAIASGAVFGFMMHARRNGFRGNNYRDYNGPEPKVCENFYAFNNETSGVLTKFFICPLEGQGSNYNECCGEHNKQHCCRFWDKPGKVFGVVFGILLGIFLLGLIVYCCYKSSKNREDMDDSTMEEEQPMYNANPPAMKMSSANPGAPYAGTNTPYPVTVAPSNQPYPMMGADQAPAAQSYGPLFPVQCPQPQPYGFKNAPGDPVTLSQPMGQPPPYPT